MYRCMIVCIAVLVSAGGCAKKPQTAEEMKADVVQARDDAKAAHSAKDPKAAERAAKLAERTMAVLQKMSLGEGQAAADAKTVLAEADEAAHQTYYLAELTDEEDRLAKILNGLRAKAYRAGRAVALTTTFKVLGLAAEQAGKNGLQSLPEPVRDAANCAADFADVAHMADGSHDWAKVAAQMNARAANPPAEIAVALAAGFLLCGQNRLALMEVGMFPGANAPAQSTAPEPGIVPYEVLIRALAYRGNGLNHLAVAEFGNALAMSGGDDANLPWSRAQVHLLSAIAFTYEGNLTAADKELMEAVKADPGGPLAAFITGERLTASGEYEAAAESLETYLAKTGEADVWLAKRLTERAREIRDKKGDAEPLCHDLGFACEVGLHYMGQDAAKSPAGHKLNQWVESARRFSAQLTSHLPGSKEDDK